jgi:hypothetical protein
MLFNPQYMPDFAEYPRVELPAHWQGTVCPGQDYGLLHYEPDPFAEQNRKYYEDMYRQGSPANTSLSPFENMVEEPLPDDAYLD